MAKAAAGLTVLKAKSLIKEGKAGRHADGAGLYLHVTKPGVAVWSLRYTFAGKAREMGLGTADPDGKAGGVSLAEARDRAAEGNRLVRSKVDPIEQRRAQRDEAVRERELARTFKEVAELYIATQAGGWRNAKHRAQWSASLAAYAYPKIGNKPVGQVTREEVLSALRPIWSEKRETARRVRQRMEVVFNFAEESGWRDGANPVPAPKAADRLLGKVPKEVKHHAALPRKEMTEFLRKLRARGGTAARGLEFVIFTAARTNEVLGARWSEVDLEAGIWTIPATRMKAGKEHRVPLSAPALAVLAHMAPARPEEGDGWIFPGQTRGKPLSNMSMLAALKRMEAGTVTTHGFRATFKGWSLSAGFPDPLSELALAHTDTNKVRAAYAREDMLEERRPMMDAWANFCDPPPADVVNLASVREQRAQA